MNRKDHIWIAEAIRDSPVSHAARRRIIQTFCNRFAGAASFDRNEFVAIASSGSYKTLEEVLLPIIKEEITKS